MGCGASSEEITPDAKVSNVNNNKNAENGHIGNGDIIADLGKKEKEKPRPVDNNNASSDKNIKSKPPKSQQQLAPVPKSIAFDVGVNNAAADTFLKKNPPKRLQNLAPLENAPKLTAEQLEEKIRQAEDKRNKELEKKKETAHRSSRLRRKLLEAKQFEQQQEQENQQQEINIKQRSADRNREAKQKELEEKKRRREERAKKIRERAAQLKIQNGEDIDYEIEKDDDYNADDTDSWLDGDNNVSQLTHENSGLSERLYSGRESPHKTIQVRSNEEHQARMSAFSSSTTDSFDYAFQRKPPMAPVDTTKHDDFFDS